MHYDIDSSLIQYEFFYSDYPTLIESNCNYETNNCIKKVFHRINGEKLLTYEYFIREKDSLQIKWYFNQQLLADINFLNGVPSGEFSLYDFKQSKLEGFFKSTISTHADTTLRANPITLDEEFYIKPIFKSTADGVWQYSKAGKILNQVLFENDKVKKQ